ncbi:TonB-denpendent receptor [Novosphingobium barchaimii LL02]|uniref:TonB-denpendent receptor n=1 Tax=Novosphingobium barchaimii LL02 TaxID=1114963 RepID=A0A0J8APU1_9SPHN|nr:TonB-dependent receptor [Novosphingobium barchaimii]KMS56470.1 TonB-denpendent receptor [Novosphingobium barchaimii LL02]
MNKSVMRTLLVATAISALPTMTMAQEAAPEADAPQSGFGDIVVSAQRIEQRLQDVPISVTAITAAEIETRQVLAPTDIGRLAPNVNLTAVTGGSAGLTAYIRGGGVTDGGYIMSEPEVALYVNDVYNARMQAALLDFAEIERIEVLRGPQGVLYGRNAAAGAINIITKQPADTLTGNVQVGYGTWNERRVKGYLSVPISKDGKWAFSLNGIVRARDGGRQYNATLDRKVGKEDFQGGQFDLAYKGDAVKARLNLFYVHLKSDGQWASNTVTNDEGKIVPLSGSYRTVLSPFPSYTTVTQKGGSLRLSADYPGGTITSITAYSRLKDSWGEDFSGGVYPSMIGSTGDTPLALFVRESKSKSWQVSQETQVAGALADDLVNYVAGLYFFHEQGDQDMTSTIFFAPSLTRFHAATDAWAGYGQLTFNVTDQLSLVAGGRYTLEDKSLDATLAGTPAVSRDHYKKFTPKFGINFKASPDVLLYGSYTVGFKSGGYNGLASTAAQLASAYRPETTKAWEAGVKADIGRTLRGSLAGFLNKITDRQETVNLNDGGFLVENYNVRIAGIEAELAWRPVTGLQIWGNGSVNWGKYLSTDSVVASVIDNDPPSLPKYQGTIGVDYSMPVGAGTAKIGADAAFRDQYFSTPDNLEVGHVKATQLFNASVGYDVGPWTFQVAGKNLANQTYWTTGFGFSVINPRVMANPRTVLGTVKYSF